MSLNIYGSDGKPRREILSHYDAQGNRRRVKQISHCDENGIFHPAYKYGWEAGDWGGCSKSCGGGIQSRPVRCKRHDGIYMDDIFCDGIAKPAIEQPCNTQQCVTINPGSCTFNCNTIMNSNVWSQSTRGSGRTFIGTIPGLPTLRNIAVMMQFSVYDVFFWFAMDMYNSGGWRRVPLNCVIGTGGTCYNSSFTGGTCGGWFPPPVDCGNIWAGDRGSQSARSIHTIPSSWIAVNEPISIYFWWQDIRGYSGNTTTHNAPGPSYYCQI